jgi:hypothetical protein
MTAIPFTAPVAPTPHAPVTSHSQEEDELVVKSVWKSAHAMQDFPGKVTIRRFSPYGKSKIEGEGANEAEAWKKVADRIRAIWKKSEVA